VASEVDFTETVASRGGLELLGVRAQEYVAASRAANTLRAYRSDWAEFAAWAAHRRLEPLPANRRRWRCI
jgi:hypothetical protein